MIMKYTTSTKAKEIKREWHIVDAQNKILGRISTDIALKLMGKSKPYFVRNLDCGDHVVVINTKDVQVSGQKETKKVYTSFSGYPSGLKSETFEHLRARKPEEIIRRSVSGMLPKNKLRDKMLKRLYVYPGPEHKFKDKIKNAKH